MERPRVPHRARCSLRSTTLITLVLTYVPHALPYSATLCCDWRATLSTLSPYRRRGQSTVARRGGISNGDDKLTEVRQSQKKEPIKKCVVKSVTKRGVHTIVCINLKKRGERGPWATVGRTCQWVDANARRARTIVVVLIVRLGAVGARPAHRSHTVAARQGPQPMKGGTQPVRP